MSRFHSTHLNRARFPLPSYSIQEYITYAISIKTPSIGIPSRLAIGITAIDDSFWAHMWMEVWVGRWVALDPALGGDLFDATHIKMAESSGEKADLIGATHPSTWAHQMELQVISVSEK